jgi:hypothetical protein
MKGLTVLERWGIGLAVLAFTLVTAAADTPEPQKSTAPATTVPATTATPAVVPKTAPSQTPSAEVIDPPRNDAPRADEPKPSGGGDLRELIGVNPVGLKRVDVPRMPAMSLKGFVRMKGQEPMALLEIAELNRVFLVQVGTEIPITVAGRVAPVGRSELSGLAGASKAPAAQIRQSEGQSQIILKVLRVSGEGVTVEAGLLAQTIIIR